MILEAHPIDTGALHCCSKQLQEHVRDTILDFDPDSSSGVKLSVHKQKMMDKLKLNVAEKKKRFQSQENVLNGFFTFFATNLIYTFFNFIFKLKLSYKF